MDIYRDIADQRISSTSPKSQQNNWKRKNVLYEINNTEIYIDNLKLFIQITDTSNVYMRQWTGSVQCQVINLSNAGKMNRNKQYILWNKHMVSAVYI